jgi:hypothetical protein
MERYIEIVLIFQITLKCPIKTIPEISKIVNDELVSVCPRDMIQDLTKSLCFVEAGMKTYMVNNVSGIAFNLISVVVVGKATVDCLPSPPKRALMDLLESRKKAA